jgi:hypothetical protein
VPRSRRGDLGPGSDDGEGLGDALLPSQRVTELRKEGGQTAGLAKMHLRDANAVAVGGSPRPTLE